MMKNYLDLFKLHQKNALITGANGILGAHFCAGLASAGANLIMLDKSPGVIAAAAKIESEYPVNALGIECDITKPDEVERAFQIAQREVGDIHIVHNNAAWKSDDLQAFFAPFEEYSLDTWKQIMAVNIDAMFLVSQAAAKHMKNHGNGGSIIQTASIYGIVGPDQRIYEGSEYLGRAINTPVVYSASKASVVGLTKYLATYLAPYKIRVNTITPGGVGSGQNNAFQEKYANRVPLGRMADADEMVAGLIYLASDASSYVTGQNLIIDGGLTVW
jgi:NAD(P)-dependent dehydrogenase (short-subunit alcohol dehydrogenase family)